MVDNRLISMADISRMMDSYRLVLQHPLTFDQATAFSDYNTAWEDEQKLNSNVGGPVIMGSDLESGTRHFAARLERLNSNPLYQRASIRLGETRTKFYDSLREDPQRRYSEHPLLFPRAS